MATVGNERHLRYILLMGEGGTLVLREILTRETVKAGKPLEELLNANSAKRAITRKLDKEVLHKVYPSIGVPDVNSWDISMLAKIILQLFKKNLTGDECSGIKDLKELRNELAHASSLSMEENEYDDDRKELAAILIKLSDGLDSAVHNKCQNLIKDSATGLTDSHAATERVKELSKHDKKISKELRRLTGEVEDISRKVDRNHDELRDIKRMLLNKIVNDTDFPSFRVIETDMAIRGSNDDLSNLAEKRITEILQTASERTGDDTNTQTLTEVVRKILADMRNCHAVEVCRVEKHSIRLQTRSKSCRGLLEFLDYLEGNAFKENLKELEIALGQTLGSTFRVTATITRSSLTELNNALLVTEGEWTNLSSERKIHRKQTDCTRCPRKDCTIKELQELVQSNEYNNHFDHDTELLRMNAKMAAAAADVMNREQKRIERKRQKSHSKELPTCIENYNSSLMKLKRVLKEMRELTAKRRSADQKSKRDAEIKEPIEKLDRMTSLPSSKLRDKNPNISDLSDQNIPTQIAKKMSELYDIEWADAYDALKQQGLGEGHIIQTLLDTLMVVYKVCSRLASEGFFERGRRGIKIPVETQNDAKITYVLVVKKKIRTEHDHLVEIQMYLARCIEIGWLCAVQNPPLVLKAEASEKFDTKIFKGYTKRGKYIVFVVLPALYLHDGGVLLAKGVAQGSNHARSCINKTSTSAPTGTRPKSRQLYGRQGYQQTRIPEYQSPIHNIQPHRSSSSGGRRVQYSANGHTIHTIYERQPRPERSSDVDSEQLLYNYNVIYN